MMKESQNYHMLRSIKLIFNLRTHKETDLGLKLNLEIYLLVVIKLNLFT